MDRSRDYSRKATTLKLFHPNSITITSETAVGKSATLRELRSRLGPSWTYTSGGEIMRKFAKDLGISIKDFARINREHPERGYDKLCDQELARIGQQDRLVAEGRLTHVFVPMAFHVKIICPMEVRASRRAKDLYSRNLAQVSRDIAERDRDDNDRYGYLYPNCLWPNSDFDLLIHTN